MDWNIFPLSYLHFLFLFVSQFRFSIYKILGSLFLNIGLVQGSLSCVREREEREIKRKKFNIKTIIG